MGPESRRRGTVGISGRATHRPGPSYHRRRIRSECILAMEDLIAYLYPFGESKSGYAHQAVSLPQNESRFLAAKTDIPEVRGRNSRESTAPLDDYEDTTDLNSSDRLQLTFTSGPKAGPGFVLGTDSDSCDLVLPRLPSISRRHCYLTFDTERRFIVRDFSTNGTIVKYDGRGSQKRRHFTWTVGGQRVPNNTREIIIQLDVNLKFQIVLSKPSNPSTYSNNVDNYLKELAANASLRLGALGIQSHTSTAAPSGTQSPTPDPILLEQETLGKGAYSVVNRVWNVSNGFEFASKKFYNVQKSDWRKEASLMRQISHVSRSR